MLMPSIFGENLFDDFFDLPQFPDMRRMERQIDRKLYGHHAQNMMKVDVKEKEHEYEMLIDLPGFTRDEITAQLKNGYLIIAAAKGLDEEEQEKDSGKYIRRERYAGSCQRSFFIGENLRQEDIKAEFRHGILKLTIPKEQPKLESKSNDYIAIEG